MKTSLPQGRAALLAGAATADVTPSGSVFLFGYPHVPRNSTGVHDPLLCSALFLQSGTDRALFLANDLIFVSKQTAADVRRRIRGRTGIPEEAIMITATHTHSGPITLNYLSNAHDPVVPKVDAAYVQWAGDQMVAAACAAVENAQPAEIGLAVAKAEGVGTNRHDVKGPADPDVPVLVARSLKDRVPIGCMVVYAMHPTVLHEDSTLISGDFPHFTRALLNSGALPTTCPVIYHNGTSGNQSPRHVTKGNTFAEAQRVGENLARAIARVIPEISFRQDAPIRCARDFLKMELRTFPTLAEVRQAAELARKRFQRLKKDGAPAQQVRTAECDWFGADESVALAEAASDGRLQEAAEACMPAEIQLIRIGEWNFLGWPGEFFVEFGLAVRAASPSTFVITMANGELQGYIVTNAAVAAGVYEAGNALFSASNGSRVVDASLRLLKSVR